MAICYAGIKSAVQETPRKQEQEGFYEGDHQHHAGPGGHWPVFAGRPRRGHHHHVTGAFAGDGIAEQTRQSLKNVQAVLEAGGSSLGNVLKTTVFLKNMDDFAAMNEVYATFFEGEPPARSAVEVARLPKGALVEIEAIAFA